MKGLRRIGIPQLHAPRELATVISRALRPAPRGRPSAAGEPDRARRSGPNAHETLIEGAPSAR